jgi:hypothetical protein
LEIAGVAGWASRSFLEQLKFVNYPADPFFLTPFFVRNQKEHHKTMTFKEEFLKLLDKHDLPYDDRYIWE